MRRRGEYGFHFSFDDDFGFIVDDALVTALDKAFETWRPGIRKFQYVYVYHCVLFPVCCPFEAVEAVPFEASLAEDGVICRPPATLVYAGSRQREYLRSTMRDVLFIATRLCDLSLGLFPRATHLSTILAVSRWCVEYCPDVAPKYIRVRV